MQQNAQANTWKDKLIKLGYYYTMSLYAVINNPETGRPEYRRVEVFINGPPNQRDVASIREFFREVKPYQYYSIWAYNRESQEIIQVEAWD